MKFLYFLRVLVISFEFLVVLVMAAALLLLTDYARSVSATLSVNEELLKWAILLPISLFVWCAAECHNLIFANQEHSKILVNWDDYWMLKQHVYVSLIYSIGFCAIAAIPWLSQSGIKTGEGLVTFISSCIGGLIVAVHIYFAKISVNEILLKE